MSFAACFCRCRLGWGAVPAFVTVLPLDCAMDGLAADGLSVGGSTAAGLAGGVLLRRKDI